MRDFGEFRRHWRPLLAASLGMGSALSLNSYILSIFAPYLIDEFGWSRSQWALLGIVQALMLVCLPVAGRLADLFGVRRVAAVGALSFPLFLIAIGTMEGGIRTYLAIYIAQTIVCSTTTATVYSRVVAAPFSVRRGLALGIAGSSPPLIGALGSPAITAFVDSYGWRAGYFAVAAFCAVCAIATLALLRGEDQRGRTGTAEPRQRRSGDYRAIAAMPVFWLMLVATFLVNLPFTLATSQLKMVVLEQGLPDSTAALLVSVFAIGSIAGRVISGAALDYLPAHIIAATGFGLPFVGLLLLASPLDSAATVTVAILLVGVSFGGEGDVIPYLVTRFFGIGVFSTVLGLLSAAMGTAMALGNAILGFMLATTDSYIPYLLTAAAGSFFGSAMFLLLDHPRFRRPALAA